MSITTPQLSMALLAGLTSVFLAFPALADDAEEKAADVEVTKKDCRRLVAHQPSADVVYQPGVDAYGRPVVPADLPGQVSIKTPDKITINLTIDILERFGISGASKLYDAEAQIGKITYDINKGKMEFNGQPLTDPEIALLAEACRNIK